jgi:hypothetical protein
MRSCVQKQISLYPLDRDYLERRKQETGIDVSSYIRLMIARDRLSPVVEQPATLPHTVSQPGRSGSSK